MTRVDRMEQLLDSLRQQLLEKIEARGPTVGSGVTTDASNAATGRRAESTEELRKRISRELQSYDLSSSAGRRQARTSFLESVFSWDFGDAVLRDPRFGTFVQSIEETIGSDPHTSAQLDELLTILAARSSI
jgi:hypothetical protein